MVFCANCGTEIGESNFCPNCGSKAPEVEEIAPQVEETSQEEKTSNGKFDHITNKEKGWISSKISNKLEKSKTFDKFIDVLTHEKILETQKSNSAIESEKLKQIEKKFLDNVEPGFREVYQSIDDEFLRVIFLLEREKLGAGVDTLSIVVSTIKTPTKGLSYEETVEFYNELLNKTRNELNLERQKPDFNERKYYKSKVKEAKIENLSFLGFKTLK